jgi:hypothetical protein
MNNFRNCVISIKMMVQGFKLLENSNIPLFPPSSNYLPNWAIRPKEAAGNASEYVYVMTACRDKVLIPLVQHTCRFAHVFTRNKDDNWGFKIYSTCLWPAVFAGLMEGTMTKYSIPLIISSKEPFIPLKVPKHEIFDSVFFASKEPIWSPDT